METLREMNMSKFVAQDVPVFNALLTDVFPKPQSPSIRTDDVKEAIKIICQDKGLRMSSAWLAKCLQLYETSIVRHGIMVVGPPRTSKTTTIDVLAAALSHIGQNTLVWRMNPKAITAPQMFGMLDASTGDWTDGVFSSLWRKASRMSTQNVWIVLDGPVDAVWIENLNTVLDDNKVLTLANGDRIRMGDQMRLFFEVEDLRNASLATVSRAGIIYMYPSLIQWEDIVYFWIQNSEFSFFSKLEPLLKNYIEKAMASLQSVIEHDHHIVALVEHSMTYLTGYINQYQAIKPAIDSVDYNISSISVEHVILFCVAWGFGGNLPSAEREKFSAAFMGSLDSKVTPTVEASIFDYCFDIEKGKWEKWTNVLSRVENDMQIQEVIDQKVIVPTTETVRTCYLLKLVQKGGGVPLV